jgi:hypothetical protein
MTLLVICTLSLTALFLLVWVNMSMHQSSRFQRLMLEQTQSQVNLKDLEIQRLTNLLASRDPLTYQMISSPTSNLLTSEPYQATGTDESEYVRWMESIHGHGSASEADEVENDLQEMGFI